jgi:hypothetical protein
MKLLKAVLTLSVILLGTTANEPAFAGGHGGGHVHFGVVIGAPFYPWYYPPSYYYPPYYYPSMPATPQTYIERGDSQAAPGQQQQSYWYYCTESKTYYPYVKDCPGGWQRVVPQPPS